MKLQCPGACRVTVTLLTGGHDKPYALGLSTELAEHGAIVDLIGGDAFDCPELRDKPGLTFINLRGNQQYNVSLTKKILRIARYYSRLLAYAAVTKSTIFHVLWHNKIHSFDRTLLLLYYKCLRKRIVLTAHDVNQSKMYGRDSLLNRVTLGIQYRLADHIFVHTEKARAELIGAFGIAQSYITLIPFGMNKYVPSTDLTPAQARQQLGLGDAEKTLLFFGRIAPYKGVEYLCTAFRQLTAQRHDYRLIIAGPPDLYEKYANSVFDKIREDVRVGRILLRSEFIPDEQMEIYFKAADILVLPYTQVYQSGVLLVARRFGLPVLAADVGSLRDDVVEGKTGFVFKPEDSVDLAATIERYFVSDLFISLKDRRREISDYAKDRYSWDIVANLTLGVYGELLRIPTPVAVSKH